MGVNQKKPRHVFALWFWLTQLADDKSVRDQTAVMGDMCPFCSKNVSQSFEIIFCLYNTRPYKT